jgi:plastin-1
MNRPAGLSLTLAISIITTLTERRQIDVDDRGSLDKATVIQALQTSGDADYDSVSQALGGL